MQKLVRDYLDELKKQRKKHRRARIAVMLLVVLVVGTVTGGLTRNGITMTEDARCGLIEHVHTDECYREVLICGYGGLLQEEGDAPLDSVQDVSASDFLREDPVLVPEEAEEQEESLPKASAKQTVGHHHTDDCYELRDVLLCSGEESEGHTHTDDCYEIETSLECGKEESEGHTHTDDCYETVTEDVLVCDSEDDEDHEHTDDCYEWKITTTMTCGEKEFEGHTHTEECEVSERVLVCNKEEYTGHEHTDDCYGQEEVLICGQKEGEEPVNSESPKQDLPSDAQDEKTEQHIHTEDCYELQPVCGIPEHTHSEECQIDTSADVEDESEWDAQYADVEWTDTWGADLVTAAQMQIGYRESEDNYRIAADGSHKGYNRYGAFAGDAYADWDAAFVNFCMYYAGLTDTDIFPQELDAGDWYDAFVEADENNIEYLTTPDGYEPEAGDLVFFERETGEGEPKKEMGIVSSYDAEQNEITVIEGDSDDEVRENTYDADDEQISSYLMITALEESVKIRILTAEGEDYIVEVRFTEAAGIPEEAVLDVREITADSDEYWEYYEQSLEALEVETLSFARCFDITFLVDGEKIEPLAPVDIRITYADTIEMDEEGENNAVHFAADGAEVLEVETDEEGRSFQFSQDSFSVTMLTSTGNSGAKAADLFPFEACNIKSSADLAGKTFLITNSGSKSGKVGIMSSESKTSGSVGLKGVRSEDVQLNDTFLWTFERAGESDIFYIKNVGNGKYLDIKINPDWDATQSGGKETGIELVDDKTELKVTFWEANGAAGICISKVNQHGRAFYLDNKGGGNYDCFVGWCEKQGVAGESNSDNRLKLYKLEWNVVLNPLNINAYWANSIYDFALEGNIQDKRIVEKIDNTVADTVSITLPNDIKRQEGFVLRTGSEVNSIGDKQGTYQWKLKGWYNIGTGEYYSVKDGADLEDGMLRVEVSRNQTNVFYADWIAADYVNPQEDKEDGDDFITTTLFDYNDLVNIMLAKKFPGKIGVELKSQASDGMSETWGAINGLSGGGASRFYFFNNALASTSGSLAKTGDDYKEKYDDRKLTDGMFKNKDSEIFKTLFSNSGAMGVQYVGQADRLYTIDKNGYYTYESENQAAVYNQKERKFTVYNNAPQHIDGKPAFLPLNAKGDGYKSGGQNVNYWFGMKTEITFWLNDAIVLNGVNNGDQLNWNDHGAMKFEFKGDDDVWVFVDNALVLDLSGVHGAWAGSINFSTGKIEEGGTARTLSETRLETGEHTLTVYYMERGSNESNCKISFNLIPTWSHEGDPAQTVTAVKEWKDADGTEYSEDEKKNLSVKVYLDEVTNQGNVEVSDSEQILNAANNWTCAWKNLDKNKTYTVREEETVDCKSEVAKSGTSQDEYWIESSKLKDDDEIIIGSGVLNVDPYVLNSNNLSPYTIGVSGNKDVLIDAGTEKDKGAIKIWYAKEGTAGMSDRPDSTISNDQVWRVHIDNNSTDKYLLFKLESASSGQYLKIANGSLGLADQNAGDVFYFSPDGTLATGSYKLVLGAGSTFEVVQQSNTLKDNKDEDKGSIRRVHIYKCNDKSVKTTYTITNTELAASIQITKVSRSEEKVLLPGAVFNIYKDGDCDAKGNVEPGASPVNETPLVSNDEGMITTGKILKVGTYYLVEAKAPEGYALMESPIIITVIKTGEGRTAEANVTKVEYQADYWDDASYQPVRIATDTYGITVPNIVLYTLPDTGGIGIYWYMFGGVLLMMSAVLITYRTKPKTEQRS